jgi:hypothetical protein
VSGEAPGLRVGSLSFIPLLSQSLRGLCVHRLLRLAVTLKIGPSFIDPFGILTRLIQLPFHEEQHAIGRTHSIDADDPRLEGRTVLRSCGRA